MFRVYGVWWWGLGFRVSGFGFCAFDIGFLILGFWQSCFGFMFLVFCVDFMCWILGSKLWVVDRDFSSRVLGLQVLGFQFGVFRVLDSGFPVFSFGFWVSCLQFGFQVSRPGFRASDFGLWVCSFGSWALGLWV